MSHGCASSAKEDDGNYGEKQGIEREIGNRSGRKVRYHSDICLVGLGKNLNQDDRPASGANQCLTSLVPNNNAYIYI